MVSGMPRPAFVPRLETALIAFSSEEKKKQAVDVKVVPMHGKLICGDRLTL